MSLRGFLVRKFLKGGHERTPLISIFGMAGVLVGVFAVIVVISVMRGFEGDLVSRLIGTQPHIYITAPEGSSVLEDYGNILEKIKNNKALMADITDISPFVESETIIYFNGVTMGGVLFAVSGDFFKKLSITKPIARREIVLGQQFGVANRVYEGDEVEVLSAWDFATAVTAAPKLRKFRVRDYVRTGTYSRDLKYFYSRLEDAVSYFTPRKGFPTGIALYAKRPYDLVDIKDRISRLLREKGNYKIETWEDRNSRIFYSLKLERMAMLFTLFFIIIVASFSLVISLVLMVESKKKDFTILLSMGLERQKLRRILLTIGLIKGTAGAFAGGILGTLFCYLLDKYKFISLPSIYYDTHLPVSFDLVFNAVIVLSA
ncbi:MAG: ABC transporter permease, partial [Oligoflexia bacterium]|nr:ABC transporter permease [Oligoflexia bacterium]